MNDKAPDYQQPTDSTGGAPAVTVVSYCVQCNRTHDDRGCGPRCSVCGGPDLNMWAENNIDFCSKHRPEKAPAVDEAAIPTTGSQSALRDAAVLARDREIEKVRREKSELAQDRDRWKLRAEKAEGFAMSTRSDHVEHELAGERRQVADLQRKLAGAQKAIEIADAEADEARKAANAAARELETTRNNLGAAFAARDRALAELTKSNRLMADAIENLTKSTELLEANQRLIAQLRAAVAPGQNAFKAVEAIAKALGVDRGTTSPAEARKS